MKSVLIIYNQVLEPEVMELLNTLELRGYTRWTAVQGRGSHSGQPHMGTHTWPALNDALLCVVEEERVDELLEGVSDIDAQGTDRGIRAFVWGIERSI